MNEKEIERNLYHAVLCNDNNEIVKLLEGLNGIDGYYDDSTQARKVARRL